MNLREARLERQGLDLAAQLLEARARQDRIRQKLQARLLDLSLQHSANLTALQGEFDIAQLECSQRQIALEAQRHSAQAERDRCQAVLDEALTERDRCQAALDGALTERDRCQAALAEASTERDRCQVALDEALTEGAKRMRLVEEQERRLARAEQAFATQGAELRAVYASLSWRLTYPLRWLNERRMQWQRRW